MMSVRAEFEKKLKDTEASVDKRMAWVLLFLYPTMVLMTFYNL